MDIKTKNIDEILNESFDFTGLSDLEATKSKGKIKELLLENTLIRVTEKLEEESLTKLESFLNNEPSQTEFVHYLTQNVPSFYTILFEEVALLELS